MSARVGRDLHLIQGAGGNSSVKIEGVLWVKASGTWLQDAERAPIFLPVDLDLARRCFSAGEEKVASIPWSQAPAGLRPSIETSLHAFLPQPIVLHVHSVNAIGWCIRAEGAAALGDRLAGLNWAWLPYCRPGLPLATEAAALGARGRAPDVLLLGNHGLVVAGADTVATETLLAEVEKRLHLDPRPAPPARMARLGGLAQGSPIGRPRLRWCMGSPPIPDVAGLPAPARSIPITSSSSAPARASWRRASGRQRSPRRLALRTFPSGSPAGAGAGRAAARRSASGSHRLGRMPRRGPGPSARRQRDLLYRPGRGAGPARLGCGEIPQDRPAPELTRRKWRSVVIVGIPGLAIGTRDLRPPAFADTHEWTGTRRLVIAIHLDARRRGGGVAGDKNPVIGGLFDICSVVWSYAGRVSGSGPLRKTRITL